MIWSTRLSITLHACICTKKCCSLFILSHARRTPIGKVLNTNSFKESFSTEQVVSRDILLSGKRSCLRIFSCRQYAFAWRQSPRCTSTTTSGWRLSFFLWHCSPSNISCVSASPPEGIVTHYSMVNTVPPVHMSLYINMIVQSNSIWIRLFVCYSICVNTLFIYFKPRLYVVWVSVSEALWLCCAY